MRPLLTAVVLCLSTVPAFAQGTVMPLPKVQFFDNNGNPCSGCLLNAYVAGTTTRLDTYSDAALTTPNTNPVQLDASGRATVFLSANSYRFTLTNATGGTTYWDQDNVAATHVGVSGVSNTGDLVFQVDTDNNGSNVFSWIDGLGTERAQLTEAGDFQIDGSLTIGDATEADKAIVFDGNAVDLYICLDDSADDLVIGRGSACGTTPDITVDGGTGNVTLAANLISDGTVNTTGDFVIGGIAAAGLRNSTSDAADDSRTALSGGGDFSTTRGAIITAFGNEHAASPGGLKYRLGNVAGADHEFYRVGDALAVAIDGDTGATTFNGAVTVTGAVAMTSTATVDSNLGVGGFITAGSGNVTITDATGNLQASALTGTLPSAVQDNITRLGTVTSGTFSGTLGAIAGTSLTSLNASNLSTGSVPIARLPTSGTWTLTGLLQLTGAAAGIEAMTMPGVSNVTVSSATDNWNPTGLNTATVFRVDTGGNGYNITGIAAPSVDWRVIVLVPTSSGGGLTLLHEDNASAAANRFLLPNASNFSLGPGETAILWYDSTSSRWRMFGNATAAS